MSVRVRELYNSEGQVAGFIGLGEDITERKRYLDALKTSEETFRSAMEHAPCGMALINPGGQFLKVNDALCVILGREEAALRATTLQALTHPDDADGDSGQMQELLANRISSYSVEKRLLDSSDQPVDVQLNLSLVRAADRKPQYFVVQIQDIRERKEIERLKSELIDIFSHELRTPLASISGSLGLLSIETVIDRSAKASRLIDLARRNCEKLVLLLSEILDIEQLQSGRLSLDIKDLPLRPLINEAVEANRSYAASLKVELSLQPAPEDVLIPVDRARFVQVLSNFISNAAKFSHPGARVDIATQLSDGRVRICVSDHGPGISDSFRSRLFQKFSQANSSSTRRTAGSGLGLYISKQLAERMGGRVGVETGEGQGATFWIELPAAFAALPSFLAAGMGS